MQDSQLQFYDAIEDFTSESESEENSEESDPDQNELNSSNNKSQTSAIVPGNFHPNKHLTLSS